VPGEDVQAVERLVELSTQRGEALDWDVLERVGELAGRTWSCSSPPTTKPASIGSPQT